MIVFGIGIVIFLVPVGHASAASIACPRSASISIVNDAAIHVGSGFAIRQVVTDRQLHQNWAIVEDCLHPERPLKMIQLPITSSSAGIESVENVQGAIVPVTPALLAVPSATEHPASVSISAASLSSRAVIADTASHNAVAPIAPTPLLIRAGDRVHLWSASTNVRLEIEAVSLDYGHAGQVIHLRRLGSDRVQTAMLAGLVDGADSAELLP